MEANYQNKQLNAAEDNTKNPISTSVGKEVSGNDTLVKDTCLTALKNERLQWRAPKQVPRIGRRKLKNPQLLWYSRREDVSQKGPGPVKVLLPQWGKRKPVTVRRHKVQNQKLMRGSRTEEEEDGEKEEEVIETEVENTKKRTRKSHRESSRRIGKARAARKREKEKPSNRNSSQQKLKESMDRWYAVREVHELIFEEVDEANAAPKSSDDNSKFESDTSVPLQARCKTLKKEVAELGQLLVKMSNVYNGLKEEVACLISLVEETAKPAVRLDILAAVAVELKRLDEEDEEAGKASKRQKLCSTSSGDSTSVAYLKPTPWAQHHISATTLNLNEVLCAVGENVDAVC